MSSEQAMADRLLARLRSEELNCSELAREFRVSVSELEKAASELRTRGYGLRTEYGGLWRLEKIPDLLLADELQVVTRGLRLGSPLHTYGRLGSTNDVAAKLANDGAPEGTLVTAEEQIRGKGRQGHHWHSPPGVGIWMSVVLRPNITTVQAGGLPLLAALAVTNAIIEITGARAQIKWPNDVTMDGLKVSGILGESAVEGTNLRYAILGIGINVNLSAEEIPPDLAETAGSLQMATGRTWRRVAVAGKVLGALERLYDEYCQTGFSGLMDMFREFSDLIGRTVRLERQGQSIVGTVIDLSPEGALILATDAGTRQVQVGEASLKVEY